ncbi:MAG: efflux RND transporter permease subunit, partial [Phycisphaerae bacterium]|nr:efflux RND transporter permease subunit [Phycisphaerae bacterium]
MDLIRFAIDKPVTVSVGVLLIVLFGLLALSQIPVQMTPNLDTTVISVRTRWEGASPQEIERDVVQEQEDKLKGISALEKMISTCKLGEGQITLDFVQGTTKEAALREVSDRLREVPRYPDNVDEPVVRATNPQDRDYIAWVVVSVSDPNFDVRRLQDFFEDKVKPQLERVPGISEVNILGGWEREVQILVEPQRLAKLGITPTRLVDALRTQNANASAGQLAEGKRDILVRSIGRFDRLDQIEDTLLSRPGEPVVRVRDVAGVELTYKEPNRTVRNKGRTVLAFNAQREVGTNVIQVMQRYKAALARAQQYTLPAEARRLGMDGEILMEQVYDQTIYINQAVNLVLQNLWIGGILATLVLLAFLRSLRSTVIVALAIPTSVIGTFLAMAVMGRSLNVISLAGLAFAVGIVVDNAIVVLENIDRHRRLGVPAHQAAYAATREVWGAILASTLTTLAVFIPILTVQEEAGQLFRDISLAICAAVSLSLLVSVTLIPSAGARWLRGRGRRREAETAPVAGGNPLTAAFGGLGKRLSDLLTWLMATWTLRLGMIVLLVLASVLGAYLLMPPSSYLPSGNRNLVFAIMSTPPGYNHAQRESIGFRVEDQVRPYWEARDDPAKAAALPAVRNPMNPAAPPVVPPPVENFFFVSIPDGMFMGAISTDDRRVAPLAALLNGAIRSLPDVNGIAFQSPLFRTARRGSADAIELEIAGDDLDQVNAVGERLLAKYRLVFGFPAVQPNPTNFDLPGPELRIDARRVETSDVGLTQGDINTAVQIFGDGAIIGDYLHQGSTIDLKVRSARADEGDAAYLRQMPVATPLGKPAYLGSLARIDRTLAPQEIARSEERRAVTLSIAVPAEKPLEQVIGVIEADIAELRAEGTIPPDISTALDGSAAKLREVKQALLGRWGGANLASVLSLVSSRMFLALLVVFLLMAALFESWLYPLVIIVSVPLATVGGFLGLRLVHTLVPTQQLDVLTMLGFVILIGVVVNNAILIVHQSLNLIRGEARIAPGGEGESVRPKLPPRQAIAESVRTRVRPIFMTTCTSVGGMLPLVLFPGSGSELYRGLGSVVVGGLIVSTLFTLLLVPLLLSVVFDLRLAAGRLADKFVGGNK